MDIVDTRASVWVVFTFDGVTGVELSCCVYECENDAAEKLYQAALDGVDASMIESGLNGTVAELFFD